MEKHPKFMLERFKIFKVVIVLKLIYRFHAIIVKIHARFGGGAVCFFLFAEIDKLILKFPWKYRGPRIAKTILNKIERLPDFKTYYKERIIKTA